MDLESLFVSRKIADGSYAIEFPEGWKQGRGLFGGLVIGALVRAAEQHAGTTDRQVRSVTAELVGPTAPGPAELRARTLRAGSAVSTVAVELVQGEVSAHAVVVLGSARTVGTDFTELAPPEAPSWREIEPFPPNVPMAPDFAQHFEFRNVGPIAFTGGDEALACGWVRPRECSVRSASYIAAQADVWWPSFFARMDMPRPIGTISFALHLCGEIPESDAPLLHRGRTTVSRAGYAVEQRELWGEDGRLVALNQQTIAIIK